MRLFQITVQSEQDGRWKGILYDFRGLVVLNEETHLFKGTVKETSLYAPTRFIYGEYDEIAGRIVFLKMANEKNVAPLLYIFFDAQDEGKWLTYSNGNYFSISGDAKIELCEIKDATKDQIKEVYRAYRKVHRRFGGLAINQKLIDEGVTQYMNRSK